jgi:hypothetical protein
MIENLNNLPELRYLRVSENYISEKYEKIYVEILHKNYNIISLVLNGNRLSLSGLRGIKKIIDRNLKAYE